MSKVNYAVQDNNLVIGLDANEDGQNSIQLSLNISEAIKEAFKKGTSVEGVKTASIRFEGLKMFVVIDSDKDGVPLATLSVDLPETIEETGLIK